MAHFVRHLLEMTAAMVAGMAAGAAVFAAAEGATPTELIDRRPVAFVAVMAISMTVPMVGWMHVRGHARRSCAEMAAAMVVPAIVLICLRATGVVAGAICGGYCLAGLAAMVALMLYRRADYAHA